MSKSRPIKGRADVIASLAEHRRREAAQDHAGFPQYDGYWDGWRIVEVVENVRTKLGVAFRDGDLVLCSPEVREEPVPPEHGDLPYEQWPTWRFVTCYSFRNRVNTGIDVAAVRELEVVD